MHEVTDQLGRIVTYQFPPKKIISLCPGITETLYALGLEKEIVGRTRYCIFPKETVEGAAIVGGTKEIQLEKIKALHPDLIIVEKEENTQEIVDSLEKFFSVYVHEVQSIEDAHRMIDDLGDICNRQSAATQLTNTIQERFQSLPHVGYKRAAYVIWQNPYMVVGKDTYINSLLEKMGFLNPFTGFPGRYPSITQEDFLAANLDYVFLASEPFSFKEKHKKKFQQMLPNSQVMMIDGEMFWYGGKMVEAATYFDEVFGEWELREQQK